MIARVRNRVRRHWPRLRLRTILFATLFVVAALPGVGAVFLRVYENTLVRQTEAELIAQGAALAAAAAADWPIVLPAAPIDPHDLRPEPPSIDLNSTPVLPERPAPEPFPAWLSTGSPDAVEAARRLAPVFAATRRTTLASIVLLDGNGLLVSGPAAGRSYVRLPEVARALGGMPTTVLRRNGAYRQIYAFEWLSRAAAIRVHHARPVVVGGQVVGVLLLSRSARSLFRGLYADRGKIAIGIGVILAMLVVLSGLLSRGIARPIEALGAATRAVAAGRGTVPDAPPTAAIEIQGLYADFAAMAAAIERRSRYLRDFAHAVSHEFKTPLAGIRGAIELLDEHGETMATGERRRFLANADADARRLTALVTRLLELARADMAVAPDDRRADVAAVVRRVADAERSDALAIAVHAAPGLPDAAIGDDALAAILAALIDNARQAGAATVTIDLHDATQALVLSIADDGPGIAPGDHARVFEPFFTTRRGQGGTGLGLSIVRSLLDASGATIALGSVDRGTCFVVTIPPSPTG